MWGPSEFTATGNLKNVDLMSELYNITVPTLITCGRFDTATPKTMQTYVQQLLFLKIAHTQILQRNLRRI